MAGQSQTYRRRACHEVRQFLDNSKAKRLKVKHFALFSTSFRPASEVEHNIRSSNVGAASEEFDSAKCMWRSLPMTEQSPSPRIPLKLEVEYRKSYGRNADFGLLKNISLTGAFLEHENDDLKAADKVCITFKVGGRIRKINAAIIWANGKGAGIKFLPMNNRDVQIVDDLMYFVESKREGRRDVLDGIFKQAG